MGKKTTRLRGVGIMGLFYNGWERLKPRRVRQFVSQTQ